MDNRMVVTEGEETWRKDKQGKGVQIYDKGRKLNFWW